jgi:hypothetical protein
VAVVSRLTTFENLDYNGDDGSDRYLIYMGYKGEHSEDEVNTFDSHDVGKGIPNIKLFHKSRRIDINMD